MGYFAGLFLMGSTWGVMTAGIIISGGVGLAYGAMPALIMESVPSSEMGSANSVNTLMRSIGTTTSAAVLGVILTQMSADFGGLFVPSELGLRVGLVFGGVMAIVAATVASTIPPPWKSDDDVVG